RLRRRARRRAVHCEHRHCERGEGRQSNELSHDSRLRSFLELRLAYPSRLRALHDPTATHQTFSTPFSVETIANRRNPGCTPAGSVDRLIVMYRTSPFFPFAWSNENESWLYGSGARCGFGSSRAESDHASVGRSLKRRTGTVTSPPGGMVTPFT